MIINQSWCWLISLQNNRQPFSCWNECRSPVLRLAPLGSRSNLQSMGSSFPCTTVWQPETLSCAVSSLPLGIDIPSSIWRLGRYTCACPNEICYWRQKPYRTRRASNCGTQDSSHCSKKSTLLSLRMPSKTQSWPSSWGLVLQGRISWEKGLLCAWRGACPRRIT